MKMQSNWYPICFESKAKYISWQQARDYAHEVASVCDDCNADYSEEMQRQKRCIPQDAMFNSTNSKKPCKPKIIQSYT
jgi:hypothetical protein